LGAGGGHLLGALRGRREPPLRVLEVGLQPGRGRLQQPLPLRLLWGGGLTAASPSISPRILLCVGTVGPHHRPPPHCIRPFPTQPHLRQVALQGRRHPAELLRPALRLPRLPLAPLQGRPGVRLERAGGGGAPAKRRGWGREEGNKWTVGLAVATGKYFTNSLWEGLPLTHRRTPKCRWQPKETRSRRLRRAQALTCDFGQVQGEKTGPPTPPAGS